MEHLLDERLQEKFARDIVPLEWFGFEDQDQIQRHEIVPIEEYPLVRGWSKEKYSGLKRGYALDEDGLAMLQSMLFFGCWEFISEEPLSTKEYIFASSRRQFLKTMNLRKILESIQQEMKKEEADNNSANHQERLDRFQQTRGVVFGWYTRFVRDPRYSRLIIGQVKALGRQNTLLWKLWIP